MPSKVKIKIFEAKDLPVMDRNQSVDASTDAFVVVTIGDLDSKSTKTCRKTLNPVFNTDFSIEVLDDSILQNAPVEFKVMDQDLYTSELIGAVYIDMNPLIMRTAHGSEDLRISGWFPLFDTVKGVRGYLNLEVKLIDFIGNSNQFSDASSGVQFFSGSSLANNCFIIQEVLGFVADLVVEDDPESSWQDYFRKNSKSSNDQRLKLLYNLSATVRCEIGKKVIEAGGNAVLGYSQSWDAIEGATGIVARGYGTMCRILKVNQNDINAFDTNITYADIDTMILSSFNTNIENMDLNNPDDLLESNITSFSTDFLKLLKFDPDMKLKGSIPLISFGPMSEKMLNQRESVVRNTNSATMEDSNDVQLLTLTVFPKYARIRLGGLVIARSVKFLGKLEATLSDQETREEWWEELRDEIKAHAKILCCTHILGYTETFSVFGDVCVLSCIGTAATVTNLGRKIITNINLITPATCRLKIPKPCEHTHVPYSHSRAPFQFMRLVPCLRCKKKWVPEVILCTIEPSITLPIKGKGLLLEARTCRIRKVASGETDAVKLSGILPFLEYEVQRQLMLKLKVLGMNTVFGYDSRLQIGSNMVILTATCTACFVASLPPPPTLQISKTMRDMNLVHDKRLLQLEKDINDLTELNLQRLEDTTGYTNNIDASNDRLIDDSEKEKAEKESVSSSSTSSSSESDDNDDDLESPSSSSSSNTSVDEEEEEEEEQHPVLERATADEGTLQEVGVSKLVIEMNKEKQSPRQQGIHASLSASSIVKSATPGGGGGGGVGRLRGDSSVTLSAAQQAEEGGSSSFSLLLNSSLASALNTTTMSAGVIGGKRGGVVRKAKKVLFKDDRPPFILDIDEETGADLSAVIEDWDPPIGIDMVNTMFVPGSNVYPEGEGQQFTLVKRSKLSLKQSPSLSVLIGLMFQDMYLRLCFNARNSNYNCHILGIHHTISILDEEIIEIVMSAILYKTSTNSRLNLIAFPLNYGRSRSDSSRMSFDRSNRGSIGSNSYDEYMGSHSPILKGGYYSGYNEISSTLSRNVSVTWEVQTSADLMGPPAKDRDRDSSQDLTRRARANSSNTTAGLYFGGSIILTPLHFVPGYRIIKYLGQIQLHFVKDSLAGRGEHSMDTFYHTFISEANAITRSHVEALRGNALVNFRIYPLEAGGRVYRNQAYNMLTLCGDAVEVGPALT